MTDWAHANNALMIGVVNPTSLAVLKPPGEWGKLGADIAVRRRAAARRAAVVGRPVLRLHGDAHGARAPDAGPHHRPHARPRRQARFHAHAAGARAAHPPQQGDVQHLHQPGPAGDGRDDLHVAARGRRAWRRWRRRRCSARSSWWMRSRACRACGSRSTVRASTRRCCCSTVRSSRCSRRSRAAASSAAWTFPRATRRSGNALLVCATETRTLADIETYAQALAETMRNAAAAA